MAFLMFTSIFFVIAANVMLLGAETRGRTLEEIAGEPGATRDQGATAPCPAPCPAPSPRHTP